MIIGAALCPGSEALCVEAGGPQWLTWRQIADIIAATAERKRRKYAQLTFMMGQFAWRIEHFPFQE